MIKKKKRIKLYVLVFCQLFGYFGSELIVLSCFSANSALKVVLCYSAGGKAIRDHVWLSVRTQSVGRAGMSFTL